MLQTGNIFTNEDFKEIALAYYYNKQCNDNKPISFSCSNGFINDFKKRHKFSSKKFHFKRRPDLTHEQEIEWIMHLKDLLNTVENQRIVNCDETAHTHTVCVPYYKATPYNISHTKIFSRAK